MISKENKVFISFHILKIFDFTRGLWKKPIDSSNELRLCCDSLCPVLKRWHIQRGQHVWTQRCCPGYSSWRIFRILKVRKLRNQKSWEKFEETPVKTSVKQQKQKNTSDRLRCVRSQGMTLSCQYHVMRWWFCVQTSLGLSDLTPPDTVGQGGDVDYLAMRQSAEFGAPVTICLHLFEVR